MSPQSLKFAIQIRISGEGADQYVDEWLVGTADVTSWMRKVGDQVEAGLFPGAARAWPAQHPPQRTAALIVTLPAENPTFGASHPTE